MKKSRVRLTPARGMDAMELNSTLADELRALRSDKSPPERANAVARIAGQMIGLWRLNFQAKLRGLPTGKALPLKA